MLVGKAPLIPTLWNMGILHYKQAKLRKDMCMDNFIIYIFAWQWCIRIGCMDGGGLNSQPTRNCILQIAGSLTIGYFTARQKT